MMELGDFVESMKQIDEYFSKRWNGMGGKPATVFLQVISFFGRETMWLALIAFYLFIWYDPLPFVYIGTTFLNGLMLILPLKQTFKRERPFEAMEGVESLEARPTSRSFPSWHSYNVSSQALTLGHLLNSPILTGIFLIIAILVAFSRIQLGVHYFSDVVVGYVLGIIGFLLMLFLLGPLFYYFIFQLERMAVCDIYYQQVHPWLYRNMNPAYILLCFGIFGMILLSAIYKLASEKFKIKTVDD